MSLKRDRSVVKGPAFQAADEAGVSNDVVFFLFFISQIGKRINDNTKNEIENNNNDSKVEEHIVDDANHELKVTLDS